MALVLDRQVRDAAAGIELVGRRKRVGRTDVEAAAAGAAMVRLGRVFSNLMVFMVADRKCGTFRHGHLLCRRRTTVRSEAARHNRGHGLSPRVAVGREPRELHHVGFDELDVLAY